MPIYKQFGNKLVLIREKKFILLFLLFLCLGLFIVRQIDFSKIKETSGVNKVKEEKYGLLQRVSVEVQVDYLSKLLREPVYKNTLSEGLSSYIYVDPDYYVWVLANEDDRVLAYAVTSRKEDFNPSFSILDTEISINKTSFSGWIGSSDPNLSCYRFIGAHDPIYYFEKVYLGNPGLYQTYWVGINNAGYFNDVPAVEGEEKEKWFGQINCGSVTNRELIKFNTFMVWGPFFEIPLKELEKNPTFYFGVDNIQTRTLNE